MHVAVLGAGNGGCAIAFEWAHAGHTVSLFDFPEFPANILAIARQGGIRAQGDVSGFAPIAYAGHDADRAVQTADVLFVVGPAYSTEPFAEVCRGRLRDDQTVVICPGSCGGALVFRRKAGLVHGGHTTCVAETSTLPYAVRLSEPGQIQVFLRLTGGVFLAALPGARTAAVLNLLRSVYPFLAPARNVLQTALQNGNPVIHPAVSLLNAARIERSKGEFMFYEEGVTPAVGRLMQAVDRERIAIGAALGLEIIPDPELGIRQGYMTEATYCDGYNQAPGFRGIHAQTSLDHRYFHEDVGYGLVFMTSLARVAGVPTPAMDAVIDVVSVLMGRDYRGEGMRTAKSLGLNTASVRQLLAEL